MSDVGFGIVILFCLLAFFLTGIEMAFAMALLGFFGFGYLNGFESAMGLLAQDFLDAFQSYSLTVVPLFIFMGQIAFNAGIARRLYDTTHKFAGHIPGGLAIATVLGATAFKSVCGSVAATSATFASVAVPEMDRYGYDKKLSAGTVATVGTLGVLLPPSVTLIVFGVITQQSIGKLFLAGIFPGLILSALFVFVIIGWCKIRPSLAPRGVKFPWRERVASLPAILWPIIIFIVIIGGLMSGVFTPTEAGSIGAFVVLLVSWFKKDIHFSGLVKSVREALRTACMVMLLVAASSVLGHFIAVTNITSQAADWITGLPLDRNLIMIFIVLVYLVGGTFIDDLAFMILATPVFYPAAIKLGFDPLWVGIIIALSICIGCVIPPVALCVFVVKNITKLPLGVIYGGVYPFLVSLIFCVFLIFLFPDIALYLPRTLMR